MANLRRVADDPKTAWDYCTIYSPKGAADEIVSRWCWPNDEDETVGLLVLRIRRDGMVDLRVNPVLVTWRDGECWLWARDLRSKLVGDTYAALEFAGIVIRGQGQVTHLRKVNVDWLA